MSAKHTPGPWSFGYGMTQEHGYVLGVGVNTKPDWTVVCAVSKSGDVNAIDEANARLIAAAPDLLEALRNTVNLLHIWIDGAPPYDEAQTDREILAKSRAAISKAIG